MKTFKAIAFLCSFLFLLSGKADAFNLPAGDREEIANILYAEAADDPEGWHPKLNTYHKARRGQETLLKTMKRVSSAYRTKSRQYKLASSKKFNAYERRVHKRIVEAIDAFKPDPKWKYVHHEDFRLYPSREAALAHLRKAWGPDVDFVNCKKIGKEHYFAKCP